MEEKSRKIFPASASDFAPLIDHHSWTINHFRARKT